MTAVWARMLETIDAQGAAALVGIVSTAGSVPREAGARLVMAPDGGFWGTVGGGALEWELTRRAGDLLAQADPSTAFGLGERRDWPLGPDLGQCCGGRVTTLVEVYAGAARPAVAALAAAEAKGGFDTIVRLGPGWRVDREILASSAAGAPLSAGAWHESFGDERTPLWLVGAGHVGRALVLALAPLPFAVRWIDPRPEAFPAHVPANVVATVEPDPAASLAGAPCGASLLVMSHSHALDLAVIDAALRRSDLGFVGLIGSLTKRARFLRHLGAAGLSEARLADLVCPIGVPGLAGKEPAVIAASVAVQLLQDRQARAQGRHDRPAVAGLRGAGGRS